MTLFIAVLTALLAGAVTAKAGSISFSEYPAQGGFYSDSLNYPTIGFHTSGVQLGNPECQLEIGATVVVPFGDCGVAPFHGYTTNGGVPPNTADWIANIAGDYADEGQWKFSVRGNYDATLITATRSFIVDNTGPEFLVTSPAEGQLFGTSIPTLSFSANDVAPGTGIASLECKYETTGFVPCDTGFVDTPLADGAHTFTVRAADGAGNESSAPPVNFTIDLVNPVVTLDQLTTPSNNSSTTAQFSVVDAHLGVTECRHYLFGDPAPPAFSACTSTTTYGTSGLADGKWVIELRHTDLAGRVGFDSQAFTVDTVAPNIIISSPLPNQVMETSIPELGLGATDPDPGTGVSLFECAFDSDAIVGCGEDAFANRRLGDGAHTLTARATDGAGNVQTVLVPFSVNSSLRDGSTLPVANKATFKRLSAKVRKVKLRLRIRVTFGLPAGVDAGSACNGRARISATGRLPRKKRKTFSKSALLKPMGAKCVATATVVLPRAYKQRKLTAGLGFGGNDSLGSFTLKGSLK